MSNPYRAFFTRARASGLSVSGVFAGDDELSKAMQDASDKAAKEAREATAKVAPLLEENILNVRTSEAAALGALQEQVEVVRAPGRAVDRAIAFRKETGNLAPLLHQLGMTSASDATSLGLTVADYMAQVTIPKDWAPKA
jgi:hypothetical protein